MNASPLRTLVAAAALAAAPAAFAQSESAFDPCGPEGRARLEALVEYHLAPNPADFVAAWQTLFCGESSIRHASQRVGFPFLERFTLHDGSRVREESNALDRNGFIANYRYLDRDHRMADHAEFATSESWSPSHGELRMRFEGDAGTGSRAFRLYRGKWIWVDEHHVIEEGTEGGDEPGC